MDQKFNYTAQNTEDTKKLAGALSGAINLSGFLICLYGDIGSGKTTFVKYLAEFLGIKEKVTSPSFVILNEYRSETINLYHFDLYRLEKEGISTILDELSEYTEKENSVTVIEWAEFSDNNLPEARLDIEIKYINDTQRDFFITAYGENNLKIIKKLKFSDC